MKLKPSDILLCQMMPPSLKVHIVRIAIDETGVLEFAEWVSGIDNGFHRREELLTATVRQRLAQQLSKLADTAKAIPFDAIKCDFSNYERPQRELLMFRVEGKEVSLVLPTAEFFVEHSIEVTAYNAYNQAFEAVIQMLPTDWISVNP